MNINLQKASRKIILSIFMMFMTFCMLSMNTVKVSAHDAYFLGIAYDSDSKRYIGTISFQSNSVIGDNHAESAVSTEFYLMEDSTNNIKVPVLNYNTLDDSDSIEDAWSNLNKTEFDNEKELLFTFPGYHTKGWATDKLNANGADELLAERICNTLIPQLNACLDFIISECYTTEKQPNANEVRDIAVSLVNAVDTTGVSGSIGSMGSVNGTTISLAKLNTSNKDDKKVIENAPDGITKDDYVKVTINGKSAYFIFQCWKGYTYPTSSSERTNNSSESDAMKNDPYARDTKQGDWWKDVGKNSAFKIGWDAIVAQAHFNLDIKGVQFSNLGTILPTSALINAIATLCDWAITGIRSFLGLYSLDELMLNGGTRGLSYTMGLFPSGWVGPIYLMYTVCTMITWGIMGFAVIRIFMRRQLATINVGEKMNIMNELKNLIVCCFLLGAFPFVFNMLARINNSLVDLFGSTTAFSDFIKSFYTLSQVSLGSILACFMGLVLQIYFNFFYILRAITLAILYAIAPLCIYTIVLGGKHSKVFGAWMKELLSNIFVQTIHALMIAFFTSVSAISGLKVFESLVVLYSFIPLTKFVKQNVFQSSDGLGGTAMGLTSMATSGANGVLNSVAGGSSGGGSSSGGSSGGGSAGGFSGGTGIAADRMANINNKGAAPVANSFKEQATLTGSKATNTLANWASGQKANGEGTTNKLAHSIGQMAEKNWNHSNASKGYQHTEGSNMQTQWLARPSENGDIKMPNEAKTTVGKVAKGVGSTALRLGAGVGMVGMGMGLSAIDANTGSRVVRQGAGMVGSAGSVVGNLKNSFKNDAEFKQYLRNNGLRGFGSDHQKDYAVSALKLQKDDNGKVIGLDKASQPLTMSDKEFEQHNKIFKAFQNTGDMSQDERAYWMTKAQARGLDYGRDGEYLKIGIEKTNAQYQRNGVEMLHSSYAPYVPKPVKTNESEMGGGRDTESAPENYYEHKIEGSDKSIFLPNSSPKPNGGGSSGPTPSPESEDEGPIAQPNSKPKVENDNKVTGGRTTPPQKPKTNQNLTYEKILQMEQEGYTQPGTSVKEQMQHRNERKKS